LIAEAIASNNASPSTGFRNYPAAPMRCAAFAIGLCRTRCARRVRGSRFGRAACKSWRR